MTLPTKRVPMPSLLRRTAAEPALPDHLELAAGSLPVTVRRNPRAKRMILRLAPGASGVVVTAPREASARAIRSFLERHRGWVEDRLSRAPERIAIAAGATIPFRGASLLLLHVGGRLATRIEPIAAGEAVAGEAGMATAPADAPYGERGTSRLLVGGAPEHFGRRVTDFLKREARRDLEAAVKRHAASVGLEPKAMTLKDTTSRWGSCTADRRLAFSWRIVMAPPEVLDYLAAHEVAHFQEMNHGPKFWALCRRLCPDMDHGRDWLKRHGSGLHAIGTG
ncbi:M48 family metallopeptidase [Aurantimonas sp. VKM B-3413]|uniref:M48 family metallopeptidase n=1 Tax=Aurantimonas sp. VKM B-3413 TaxID=2779401 RepID=UPI001E5963DE|nr:M48 family metallopeptidase [Aurantimonas sp. VKM B-3413]MCB8837270.1 M48 family metallopeptidase [Aurantimonas sp. VKM B-3413]